MNAPEHEDQATPASSTVMVVDDDADYCTALSNYLTQHGMRVTMLHEPGGLTGALACERPDLLLLDQRLPGVNGTDILRNLRRDTNVPCIIVTGMADQTDRIVNLEIGADDQVDKSVSPRELLARIRAVLRRHQRPMPAPSRPRKSWEFRPDRRELRDPDGALCRLTTAEYETFRLLHDHAGQPISRARLNEAVFGRRFEPTDRAVDTVIRKLRSKLGDGPEPRMIQTVRAKGYVFAGFPED